MTIRCGALPPAFAIPKLAFSLQTFAKLDFFPSSRQTLHSKCAHLLLCLRVSAVMGAIAQLPACGWCRTVHFASLPKVNQRQSQRLKARTMMEASLMTSWVPLANGVSRYTTPPPVAPTLSIATPCHWIMTEYLLVMPCGAFQPHASLSGTSGITHIFQLYNTDRLRLNRPV